MHSREDWYHGDVIVPSTKPSINVCGISLTTPPTTLQKNMSWNLGRGLPRTCSSGNGRQLPSQRAEFGVVCLWRALRQHVGIRVCGSNYLGHPRRISGNFGCAAVGSDLKILPLRQPAHLSGNPSPHVDRGLFHGQADQLADFKLTAAFTEVVMPMVVVALEQRGCAPAEWTQRLMLVLERCAHPRTLAKWPSKHEPYEGGVGQTAPL